MPQARGHAPNQGLIIAEPHSNTTASNGLCPKTDENLWSLQLFFFVGNAVEIRYNGLEGTRSFWLLNPSVVKSNSKFFRFSFGNELKLSLINKQICQNNCDG